MKGDYDHGRIEAEMQQTWEEEKLHETPENPGGAKRYILDMFPYPSGEGLHVGHVEGYTATDIYARHARMNGYNVLHPMGWDAFGLPAENYAVKTGIHPQETTQASTDNFRKQIRSLGLSYDWSREINTSSPEYYRWTQWLFLLFYEHGLAYKKNAAVNWCPGCQTVLANEQVIEGECERCHAEVEQKELDQWFFAITRYADELIESLDTLDWPESTKQAQRNWIGRSEGAEINFPIKTNRNFVILHGFTSGPGEVFNPWLIQKLSEQGYKVQAPALPNTDAPSEEEQVRYALDNINFDENTVILGHSLGSVVALKVIEKLGVKVAGLVTAGGFIDPEFKDHDRNFINRFNWSFDFDKIKSNVGFIKILQDTEDTKVSVAQAKRLSEAVGEPVTFLRAKESHFTAEKEPRLLDALLPKIMTFTTRPDTLYGATYLVLAPEHQFVREEIRNPKSEIRNKSEIENYINAAKSKTEIERTAEGKEKTGVELEGIKAVNPASGEEIPVWVADYVLAEYGTGAIMAVPAHDERDYEFAKAYEMPIVEVVSGESDLPRAEEGTLINSGELTGLSSEEAKERIAEAVGAEMKTTYRLRDWLVSRQRYWGAPIPIVYDPEGNPHPIPEKHLPWMLPTDVEYRPEGTAPLDSSQELKERTEEIFGKGWTPEVDTMDTFVDSSWYYYRFVDARNDQMFASADKIRTWLPVDVYVGGAEHSVLHLLYARFFTKVLRDTGYTQISEPFQTLRHPGIILGPDGDKMSKSKGNVINPDDMVERFGADTLRMYEMFMGPFDQAKAWSVDNMVGVRRFIERVWRIRERVSDEAESQRSAVAQATQKVGTDIEHFKFNTAISSLMVLSNTFEKADKVSRTDFETFLLLLAPFAPHCADYIWREMGHSTSIHRESWPHYDPSEIQADTVTIVVQVDGRVRANIEYSREASREELTTTAREHENVAKWLDGKEVEKVIVIPEKLVNFVTEKSNG